VSVSQIGAIAVDAGSIRDALHARPDGKVLKREELVARAATWRMTGRRIVFTNGCFDLLHAGHLSLLSQAASLGDILVLAINSDASVRRLKGPERPLVPQEDRAAVLAALGFVHVPERPVEVLIAVSIFVSAVHAFRPIFPGKEAWIAAFFGLIHGLAFAATMDRLGLGRWERVTGILAFNLGIETMQMIVVAVILPSLILLSRTRAYPILRIGGAVFAGAASVAWIVERLLDIETPVDIIVNALARHASWIAVALFLISLACRFRRQVWRTIPDTWNS